MIADSSLSSARVKEFRLDYLRSRERIGAAEKVFRYFGAFTESSERADEASFGIDAAVRKSAFIDNSGWAPLDAWFFAVAEERYLLQIFEQRLDSCVNSTGQLEPSEVPRRPAEMLAVADRLSDSLSQAGYAPEVIVLAATFDVDFHLELKKHFQTDGWQLSDELRTNWVLGQYHGRIILYVPVAELSALYAVDIQRFGSLLQFHPPVELSVEPIDVATAMKRGDLDHRRKVRLRLVQSYDFHVEDQRAVWGARLALPAEQPAEE